jgi:hypothetical protein
MRRTFWALTLLAAAARGEQVVISPGPEAVSVTVYRDPDRGPGEEMERDWLEGFALITETRTLTLPAGASTIRFEGVAGGIIPVSAIVSGLPGGVVEKNREAALLSPAALIDGSLGRRVQLQRTDRATGKVTTSDAVVLAGPEGGVVLRTRDGIEALGCAGLAERTLFSERPGGLSARPTLTVTTRSDREAVVTATLSYLAESFDWQANYVAQIAPDGRTLDLFAWLTLANGNDESFMDARTNVIAGTLNKEEDDLGAGPGADPALSLRCWPQGTTSDVGSGILPPPPAAASYDMESEDGSIVVTGSLRQEALMRAVPVTAMTAEQEELGDLKLYRIPEPVTVAANAQKQVALLTKTKIPFERLYGASLNARGDEEDRPADILLRMRNEATRGLGLPLPSGRVAVFEPAGGRVMLAGEPRIEDRAVGEEVELRVGQSPQVRVVQRRKALDPDSDRPSPSDHVVEISNANPSPVTVEVLFRRFDGERIVKPSRRLGTKTGRSLWVARVPATGRASLRYRVEYVPEPEPVESGE